MRGLFCLEMFATSKNKPSHIEAIARDQHFWRCVTWAQRFVSKVDEHRRWGAQCSCHEAERRASKSVVCGEVSLRLHEAPREDAVFLARVQSHERSLNLDEVEGDQSLLLKALTIVRRFRSDATARTKWLSDQLLTCEFMDRFEPDLVEIAAGDVSNIPQDLLAEEAIMQRIPFSSQASEGVHRQTRLVKVRARASAIPWIPASARVHQNIEWVQGLGWRTRIQMRRRRLNSWMNAKRIAQIRRGQKGHPPVQNKLTDVCACLYRLKRWGMTDRSWVKSGPSASHGQQRDRGH